ncbi:hypothetical protein [Nocardia cyriacigeorgica]|uniref:hypothetical protein n=1 Tax=Nocardia cyriacigeorgica TaxID=135487 RepID=UPI0024568BAC|nr:hypothetical protein [Nocardia cyriacigeorgica]
MATTFDDTAIDNALAELAAGEQAWAATPLRHRRELLEQIHTRTARFAGDWVRAACTIKQLDPQSPLVGEEWMSGPLTLLQATTALAETLRALEAGRSPLDGVDLRPAPGGRLAVPVLPHDAYDKLLLSGFSGEVWLRPGVQPPTARRNPGPAPRGAGTDGLGRAGGRRRGVRRANATGRRRRSRGRDRWWSAGAVRWVRDRRPSSSS